MLNDETGKKKHQSKKSTKVKKKDKK